MRYINHRNRITKSGILVSSEGQSPPLSGEVGTAQLTNKSGITLEYGDVVIIDKTAPMAVTLTNQYNSEDVIGVVLVGGDKNTLVTIQYAGIIDVKISAVAVNIGDNLYSTNEKGRAYSSLNGWQGTFAKALTSKPQGNLGTVKAILSGGVPEIY